MKELLAIEWLKIKSYRTFWILIGFFVILLPLWNYFIAEGAIVVGSKQLNLASQLYGFSSLWQNLGFWTSIFVLFISILVIILTTNEYQFRTNRQNVIDGWSRTQFYHAKWALVVLLAIGTTLFVFLLGCIMGAMYGSMSDFPGSIQHLFYVFVLSLNYYGFGLLISILFKRSGISIGVFLLYCIILETIIMSLINWKNDLDLGNYLPLQASDELLPFMSAINFLKIGKESPSMPYVLVSIGWIVLYYIIGRQKLLRSDW
jgi:hypothetical protein